MSEPETAPEPEPSGLRAALPGLALIGLTLLIYLPVLGCGFIWDDDHYVTRNPTLRTAAGLARIWFDPSATPQYYPLVHTTYWLEFQLWGLNAAGYHLVNVLLHGFAAVLLWRVLRLLDLPGAYAAALLFAIHPVHVESVAWITERKNTLSAVLYLGAALTLLPVLLGTGAQRRRSAAGALLFAGALLSKTVTCSLPAALLLAVYQVRGRLVRRDWVLMAPLFVLGLALGLNTAYLERVHVGAATEAFNMSLAERCLVAGRAVWFYLGKLAWPEPLAFIYPRIVPDTSAITHWLYPLAALALLAVLFRFRARLGRGPLTAALFFGGTLLPALGFLNVYPHKFSFVADHFQYLASIGPLALAAAGFALLRARVRSAEEPARERALTFVAIVACAVLGLLTFAQCRIYRNQDTLWRDTLRKNPTCWLAANNLGVRQLKRHGALSARGPEHDEAAAAALDEAERLLAGSFPHAVDAHDRALTTRNLGLVALARNDPLTALVLMQYSLGQWSGAFATWFGHARALQGVGRTHEAIAALRHLVEIQPHHVGARVALAEALLAWEPRRALVHAERAVGLSGRKQPECLRIAARARAATGDAAGARATLQEALARAEGPAWSRFRTEVQADLARRNSQAAGGD